MNIQEKVCGCCEKKLPATTEYFHKSKNGTYGLHSHCKECRLKARRERYVKQKEEGVIQQYYKDNKLRHIVNSMNKRSDIKLLVDDVENRLNEFKDKNGTLHCVYCGREIKDDDMLHIEHFVPIAKGGTNNLNNIAPSCRYCNRSKADEDFTYWYRNQLFYNEKHEQYILNLMKVS